MTGHYHIKAMTLKYQQQRILDIPDLKISPASRVCFVGPNGAGKTSLLNVLAFLQLPYAGSLLYNGNTVNAEDLPHLRQRIAYLQQKPYLLDYTVRNNIELGLKLRAIKADERRVKADNMMDELQIAHLAERNVQGLSGGEVQKIALARALVLEPEVLIMDEPMSYLDSESIRFLQDFLQHWQLEHQMTVLCTSHDRISASLFSDTVYSLMNGAVFESSLTNVFKGNCDRDSKVFDTGKLQIQFATESIQTQGSVQHLVVDPEVLVLSKQAIESSMRNQFQGRVTAMQEHHQQVHLTVDCSSSGATHCP